MIRIDLNDQNKQLENELEAKHIENELQTIKESPVYEILFKLSHEDVCLMACIDALRVRNSIDVLLSQVIKDADLLENCTIKSLNLLILKDYIWRKNEANKDQN